MLFSTECDLHLPRAIRYDLSLGRVTAATALRILS
jgi:hypothetical protein